MRKLSRQSIEILHFLADGLSTPQISKEMKMKEKTVKYHIAEMMRRMDGSNRTHCVAIAFRSGILKCDFTDQSQ